jgi:hypothetical protein
VFIMTKQTTSSPSFTQSFDARLLTWGAIGIGALIVAAFVSLAAPRFAEGTADIKRGTLKGSHASRDGAPAAKPPAPRREYDAAGSTAWPMS